MTKTNFFNRNSFSHSTTVYIDRYAKVRKFKWKGRSKANFMMFIKNHRQQYFYACISLIAIALSSGCHYFYDQVGEEKRIPSPVPRKLPYEIEGKIYRVWRGNELQIKSDMHTTYLILQGVNNPDSDEATEQASIDHMYSLFESEDVRAVVVAMDERKRAVAQVYSGDTNFNFEMIKDGWASFDGTQFSESDRYRKAQMEAQENRLGMWGLEPGGDESK